MIQPQRLLMTADAVGGVWRYAVDLAGELATRGTKVTLAVMGPAPSAAQRIEARKAGAELVDRPYRLEWMDDPWQDVDRAGEWLLEIAADIKPSIVHVNGYAHSALPWRSPVVVVAHSCVRTWWSAVRRQDPPAMHRYTAMVHAGLSAAHIVIAPTRAMAEGLRAEYRTAVKVRVIPNGCVPAPLRSPSRVKEPLVLAAGRVWDEAKNIAALCTAASIIDWPVYVAGDVQSPDGRSCTAPGVHMLGRLSPQELAGWYQRAAIYALPARYEPFGLSALEAANAGCALVLGDIASLRENWEGAALFVAPDDHDALARIVNRLSRSEDERSALARCAQRRAAAFTLRRTADAYLATYEALLA